MKQNHVETQSPVVVKAQIIVEQAWHWTLKSQVSGFATSLMPQGASAIWELIENTVRVQSHAQLTHHRMKSLSLDA